MLTTTNEYKSAINAPTRKIVPKAIIDLSDPDLVVEDVTGDFEATYSFPTQLSDRDSGFSGGIYATLEFNRWLLDGSQSIMPDDPTTRTGEQGVLGDTLSDNACDLGTSLNMTISGVETLQVITVASTGMAVDGYPAQLTLNIYSNGVLLYTATETPTGSFYLFEGFTVIQPTDIELVIDKWSLPSRRYRFIEYLPGFIEVWGGETIYKMDVIRKADFSNLTIPYSSASVSIDNTSKRFDPANKMGVFQSVTARQAVPLYYGVEIGDSFEYVPVGIYYQQNLGWQLDNDGLTIRWDLIDIIGLLVDRKFELKGTQPTTLAGWIVELVNQLGTTFAGHYTIDGDLGNTPLVCQASDIAEITCGDLLRFVCQAASCYPISDPETGYLHIKSLVNTTQDSITMRMQNSMASSRANQDIAFLSYDLGGTLYNIPGTAEISDTTVNIKNPFITNQLDAVYSAQMILQQYGGDVLDLKVRGNMAREVGDMVSIEVRKNIEVSGRIQEQHMTLDNGVMSNLALTCLQANGGTLYTDVIVINESGTYTMPAGVTEITLVLIGGGDGGDGGDGATMYWVGDKDMGQGGLGGLGGKVYSIPVTINDGQNYTVTIGAGGKGGAGGKWSEKPRSENPGEKGGAGEPTTCTFSATYSSASGVRMPVGYADLLTNKIYSISGQPGLTGMRNGTAGLSARPNTGNGGNGGDGGGKAIIQWLTAKDIVPSYYLPPEVIARILRLNGYPEDALETGYTRAYVAKFPTNGKRGGNGGSGCCLIFYTRN